MEMHRPATQSGGTSQATCHRWSVVLATRGQFVGQYTCGLVVPRPGYRWMSCLRGQSDDGLVSGALMLSLHRDADGAARLVAGTRLPVPGHPLKPMRRCDSRICRTGKGWGQKKRTPKSKMGRLWKCASRGSWYRTGHHSSGVASPLVRQLSRLISSRKFTYCLPPFVGDIRILRCSQR